MSFYRQIAKYYDYLFPAGQDQLDFISKTAGKPPKRILDVACGTGCYSIALARKGYELSAVDIEAAMTEAASKRAADEGLEIRTYTADLLHLDKIIGNKFDCVFCIGNSIVHLNSLESISSGIGSMKKMLSPTGQLVLQIINFDRIISKNITSLPDIYDDVKEISFSRKYSFNNESGLVSFLTTLHIKNENLTLKNTIDLLPLRSKDLYRIMKDQGFADISFYGGFKHEEYLPDESFLLVVRAGMD